MGWGFRNKNSREGIDSSNTNSVSAVDVVGEEVNIKNLSNNEYLTVPPPSKIPFWWTSRLMQFLKQSKSLFRQLSNASACKAVKQNKSLFKSLLKCLRLQGGGYPTGGGFTLIETVVGLVLVSISGFVVTFISGQMNTASKLTDDSYECAAIATNVMDKFSQGGLEPVALLNSEHFSAISDFEAAIEERSTIDVDTTVPVTHPNYLRVTHNAGVPGANLVIETHGTNSHITLKVDKLHRGSGVSLVEDLFNEYRSSICPTNVDNLTFDLADDMVVAYDSSNTAKLIDLHKELDDVNAVTPGPNDDYYKKVADNNSSSTHYAWDTFTSEYLYGLSKSIKNALNLHLLAGFTDYSTSYTNAAQPYDVKIGIRPWSLSNRSALGCAAANVHPVFLRPGSKYDRYIADSSLGTSVSNRQDRIGYKLDKTLSSANMRSDVGLKLFVEVKTRPGVDKLEKSCKTNKLFAYANSFAVPPSRRPVYLNDTEIKDGSSNFILATTHPLKDNPGLNLGYEYGTSPTKPDGFTPHTTLSDYATEFTLNFRNIGKVWNDSVNKADFRGVFLCGFEKNSFEYCVKGTANCDAIAGLSSYRTFGTGGVHKAGIRSNPVKRGSTNGSTSSPRWDLCENFKLSTNQPNNALLKASPYNEDNGKLKFEFTGLNVSSWPAEDKDADYRVRFKLVDEYGNDYSATENGQISSDDYTDEHRFFTYNCAQFGNTHTSGSYTSPPRNCGVVNPDPNIAKYNSRIDHPFYNTKADCEHEFNLLSSTTAQCVKVTDIRVYNDVDSMDERTGPLNSPIRTGGGIGVACDYWAEECVKDGTPCVVCGQGYMRDYPNTTRQSCDGGFASLGGVTCYKAGLHCCHSDYGSFNCPTGGPCSSPVGCGFNQDPTCGGRCGPNSLGCNICTGASPCNTPNCDSCSFNIAGQCEYKCSSPTQYCDGSNRCVECLNDGHCSGGDICCSNSCRAQCNADPNQCEVCNNRCSSPDDICPSGTVCDGYGSCCPVACNYNNDCSTGETCNSPGTCSANCCTVDCNYDSDCPPGETCHNPGACNSNCGCNIACHVNSDCGSGETCQDPGICTANCCTVDCNYNSDCNSGEICDSPGTCSSRCCPVACNANSDCNSGEICDSPGTCSSRCCPVACNANSDCGSDEICQNPGTCSSSCDPDTTICTSPQIPCNGTCITPTCTRAIDCTDPTKPTCVNPGTCTSTCEPCSGTQPTSCAANCQSVKCGSGGWECDTSTGCTTSTEPNCCPGNNPLDPPVCKAPCTVTLAEQNNCMECVGGACGSKKSKCVDPQTCDTSTTPGTCVTPPTCSSDADCGCGGSCDTGTGSCTSTGSTCSVSKPTCCDDGVGGKVCKASCGGDPPCIPACTSSNVCCSGTCKAPSCTPNTNTCTTCPAPDGPCGTPVTCTGTTCDSTTGKCVGCTSDSQCDGDCNKCNNNTCQVDPNCCISDDQCSGNAPCCNSSNTCGSATCVANTATCTTCNPAGNQCGTEVIGNPTCVSDSCNDCDPNEPCGPSTPKCTGSTPNCCNGTCQVASCGCDPTTKPTCSNCQTTSCGNGGWTQCSGGCSGTTPCCNTGSNTCGTATCSASSCRVCDDTCGSPRAKTCSEINSSYLDSCPSGKTCSTVRTCRKTCYHSPTCSNNACSDNDPSDCSKCGASCTTGSDGCKDCSGGTTCTGSAPNCCDHDNNSGTDPICQAATCACNTTQKTCTTHPCPGSQTCTAGSGCGDRTCACNTTQKTCTTHPCPGSQTCTAGSGCGDRTCACNTTQKTCTTHPCPGSQTCTAGSGCGDRTCACNTTQKTCTTHPCPGSQTCTAGSGCGDRTCACNTTQKTCTTHPCPGSQTCTAGSGCGDRTCACNTTQKTCTTHPCPGSQTCTAGSGCGDRTCACNTTQKTCTTHPCPGSQTCTAGSGCGDRTCACSNNACSDNDPSDCSKCGASCTTGSDGCKDCSGGTTCVGSNICCSDTCQAPCDADDTKCEECDDDDNCAAPKSKCTDTQKCEDSNCVPDCPTTCGNRIRITDRYCQTCDDPDSCDSPRAKTCEEISRGYSSSGGACKESIQVCRQTCYTDLVIECGLGTMVNHTYETDGGADCNADGLIRTECGVTCHGDCQQFCPSRYPEGGACVSGDTCSRCKQQLFQPYGGYPMFTCRVCGGKTCSPACGGCERCNTGYNPPKCIALCGSTQRCCGGDCKAPICEQNNDCDAGESCDHPGTCNAECIKFD